MRPRSPQVVEIMVGSKARLRRAGRAVLARGSCVRGAGVGDSGRCCASSGACSSPAARVRGIMDRGNVGHGPGGRPRVSAHAAEVVLISNFMAILLQPPGRFKLGIVRGDLRRLSSFRPKNGAFLWCYVKSANYGLDLAEYRLGDRLNRCWITADLGRSCSAADCCCCSPANRGFRVLSASSRDELRLADVLRMS